MRREGDSIEEGLDFVGNLPLKLLRELLSVELS